MENAEIFGMVLSLKATMKHYNFHQNEGRMKGPFYFPKSLFLNKIFMTIGRLCNLNFPPNLVLIIYQAV